MSSFKKNYINKHKGSIAAFLLSFIVAVFVFIYHSNPLFAEFIVKHVSNPIKKIVGSFTGMLSFSLAEWVWVFFILFIIAFIAFCVRKVIKTQKGAKLSVLFGKILNFSTILLIVYTFAVLGFSVNYYIVSPVDLMGVKAGEISVEELEQTTLLFIDKINDVANEVERDENGVFNKSAEEIFAESADVYNNLQQEYPVLEWPQANAKPMLFSKLMSEMNYTGFYFSFTSEANVNKEQPRCYLPSTIAHELTHLRGVAPEQDTNFLTVLVCEKSGNISYEYSGYLLAYTHLANALYSADKQKWESAYETLNEYVKIDLKHSNEYWAQFEDTAASQIADVVYETYLQSNGQEDGLKSYGRVVDLLVDYYLY